MLGHLQPSTCSVSDTVKQEYQQFYCGICSSLRKQNGLSASLMINHELTLNLLALAPFIDGKTKMTACPAAAFTQKRTTLSHPAIDQAGHLSLLLGWVKATDWAIDSGKKRAKLLLYLLSGKKKRSWEAIPKRLQEVFLSYAEKIKIKQPKSNEIEKASGELARSMWLEIANKTDIPKVEKHKYAWLFYCTGRLVYLGDALMDIEEDREKGQYNPILQAQSDKELSLEKAFRKYWLRYQFVLKVCKGLFSMASNGQNKSFIASYQNAIEGLNKKVEEQKQLLFGDLDPSQINELINSSNFISNFFNQTCCCHNCADGCSSGCNNCCGNCNNSCSNCNNGCRNCNCNCGTCPSCNCSGCNCSNCNCNGCDCSDCCSEVCCGNNGCCSTNRPERVELPPDIQNEMDSLQQMIINQMIERNSDTSQIDMDEILERIQQIEEQRDIEHD